MQTAKFLGVENLLKMADQKEGDASEGVKISSPVERSEGIWIVTYTATWGIRQFKFEDEFTIKENKITRLKRSRA